MVYLKNIISEKINWLLFYVLTIFPFVHLLCFVNISGRNLNIINTLTTLMYVGIIYIWAVFINKKIYILLTAFIMGVSSLLCILISLKDMGSSIYDALFAGAAVLTIFFVFENSDKLLVCVNNKSKYLSAIIISFIIFSIILFLFFPSVHTEWGEGIYYFGHRYASVCSCVMIIIGLKLVSNPKHCWFYWLAIFMCFLVCFVTGARIYIIANLGIFYAIIYTFSKNTLDFILKCVLITILTVVVLFNSSIHQKSANIAEVFVTTSEQKLDITGKEKEFANAVSNGRLEMWRRCTESYIELPLINKFIGSGNKYMYDHNRGLYSHQDFLNILHFNGMIGLTVYLTIFIGYVAVYWKNHKLSIILLTGFWGVWFCMALLNGYANYTANMISLPYIVVWAKYKIY